MKRQQFLVTIGIALLIIAGLTYMSDVPGRLQTGSSFDESIPLINQVFDGIDSENHTKIVRNGSTPTVLFGYQKGGFGGQDYGLKVAKAGVDVTTATDDQLAFNSAFDNFKIVKKGTMSGTVSGGQYLEVTQPHGLSFTPSVIAYMTVTYNNANSGSVLGTRAANAHYPVPYFEISATSGLTVAFVQIYTTDTNVVGRFYSTDPSTDGTYTITYYLMQETAN